MTKDDMIDTHMGRLTGKLMVKFMSLPATTAAGDSILSQLPPEVFDAIKEGIKLVRETLAELYDDVSCCTNCPEGCECGGNK